MSNYGCRYTKSHSIKYTSSEAFFPSIHVDLIYLCLKLLTYMYL